MSGMRTHLKGYFTNTTRRVTPCAAMALALFVFTACSSSVSMDFVRKKSAAETPDEQTTTEAPTFSVAAGTYHTAQSVALTSTAGSTIYYTTDNTLPTTSSNVYSAPISVSSTMTINAFAAKSGLSDSSVATASYTINVVTPVAIEAFPDTTNYPTVTWTPKVKFSLESDTTLGFFSDILGTAINTPTSVYSGANLLNANSVSTLGVTNTVYAQGTNAKDLVNMGSYTTKLPPSFNSNGINGSIYTMVKDSVSAGCTAAPNCLIIGGDFTVIGNKLVNRIAKILPDGTVTALGSGIPNYDSVGNSYIRSIGVDSTGNIYVGGAFKQAGSVSARNVAKWDGTAWSAMGAGFSGQIEAIATDATGNVYAGGYLVCAFGATLGGSYPSYTCTGSSDSNVYSKIAKWDPTANSGAGAWSPLGSGLNATVTVLAVDSSGNVYANATQDTSGCNSNSCVAKWNGSGWTNIGGFDSSINILRADSSGNLVVGGFFTCASGSSSSGTYPSNTCSGTGGTTVYNRIAKWNGSSWSPLGSGFDNYVLGLAIDGAGDIFATGAFTSAGGGAANYIAKWNGSAWSGLGTGLGSTGSYLSMDGSGNLLVAGYQLLTAGGVSIAGMGKWNGSTWSSYGLGSQGTGINQTVYALITDAAGNLYAAGGFTSPGGINAASYLAKWNGTAWSALGSGLNGAPMAFAIDASGNLYAAGSFTCAFGSTSSGTYPNNTCSGSGGTAVYNNIAKWNGTAWAPLGQGLYGAVRSIALDSAGNLYAGGQFSENGGGTGSYISKWNGTSWSAFPQSFNDAVYVVKVDKLDNIYAAGRFTCATSSFSSGSYPNNTCSGSGGTTVFNRVVKWNANTSAWMPLGSGVNNTVNGMDVDASGNVYVGGDLNQAGGTAVGRIAKWNGSVWSGLGTGLTGGLSLGATPTAWTWEIKLDSTGNLYVGGNFTDAGGVPANFIAKWDPTANAGTGAWSAMGGGAELAAVRAITIDASGNVYAGGYFSVMDTMLRPGLAKWITALNSWL